LLLAKPVSSTRLVRVVQSPSYAKPSGRTKKLRSSPPSTGPCCPWTTSSRLVYPFLCLRLGTAHTWTWDWTVHVRSTAMALTARPCANRPSSPSGIRGSDARARDSSVAAALPRDRSRNPSPICRCFWLDQHATESISTKPLPRVLLQFGLESAYFFLDSFWNPLLLLNETEHGHVGNTVRYKGLKYYG
jgi:hypothetical protein